MSTKASKKPRIGFPVLVEGKYDKIKLTSIFDCDVIVLDGFRFIRDEGKRELIKKLAETTKLIVLTDSDSAGGFIRSRIKDIVPRDRMIDIYVRPVRGREARKEKPSADGIIGIEGTGKDELIRVLEPYTRGDSSENMTLEKITTSDLYALGLTGKPSSARRRDMICGIAGLPPMSSKAFADAVNLLIGRERLEEMCSRLSDESVTS